MPISPVWIERNRPRRYLAFLTAYSCPLVAPNVGSWRGSANTTDATPQAVTLYTPTKGQAVVVKCRVTALLADGSKGAAWEIQASFRCDSTGTLAIVGSASSQHAAADASFAPTAALSASGANIIATLTGVAATNIAWNFTTQII